MLCAVSTETSPRRLAPLGRCWENPPGRFRATHPLDVLQGRLENVYGLSAKQDEHGVAQLRLAIDIARKFVGDIASQEATGTDASGRPVTLRHLARIERLA